MSALSALLLDLSKHDLAAFAADLATAEAALRCAVAAGTAAAARSSSPQRSELWGELLPAAFKAIRKLGARGWVRLAGGGRQAPAAAGAAALQAECMRQGVCPSPQRPLWRPVAVSCRTARCP